VSDLAALLDKEAGAEITAILSEARERASEIVAAAQAEAETLLAARERAAQALYEAALVRARSSAQLESSAVMLRAQHSAIESVFEAVKVELDKRVKSSAFAGDLRKLLQEALEAGGSAGSIRTVIVNPADAEVAKAAAAELGITAPVTTDPAVKGGVHVDIGTGGLAIENTLDERLQAAREELSAVVARVLTGQDG
jgi:V/A-type H+-transporting ATPase subunit E